MAGSPSNALHPSFQIVTFSTTVIIISMLVYGMMGRFCSFDEKPPIFPLTPEKLMEFSTTPARVRVGLSISDFAEFNILENKFTVTAVIWFYFDPTLISLATIEQFSFERGTIKSKSPAYTYLLNGELLARYTIRVSFKTNLYYGLFPFEDHKMYLTLINDAVSPGEMVFDSGTSDFVIAHNVYISAWRYYDKHVYTGYGITTLGADKSIRPAYHPRVIFEIDYMHSSTRYIIMIILPLLFIFAIELFSFCVDQREQKDALIALSGTDIAGLFAYRFVIESLAPKVGYFMISDYLFFLFLSTSFTVLLIQGFGPYLSINQKKVFSIALQTFIVGSLVYFLKFWAPCL
jgi:hypothetical protein